MSELAFDCNGEPFQFSRLTKRLRVRRFRNPGMRGAPEVVFDDDNGPLFVSPTTTLLEFRKRVGNQPGRYRLDQCDEDGNSIDDARPAYVTIVDPVRNSAATADERDGGAVNSVLARATGDALSNVTHGVAQIAHEQASLINAAANLLNAANGAGLPQRKPRRIVEVVTEDQAEEEEGEDEPDTEDPWAAFVRAMTPVIVQFVPLVQTWAESKVSRKNATTSPVAALAPAAPPPASSAASSEAGSPGAAAGPSAHSGPGGAPNAAFSDGTVSHSVSSPAATPVPDVSAVQTADTASTVTISPATSPRNGASPTPAQWAHLLAIRARLTPREARIAETAVLRMLPEVRSQWLAELSALSVEEAVSAVRSMMPTVPMRAPEVGEAATAPSAPSIPGSSEIS